MRVVLDANVLIAAHAARGLCEALLEYCLARDDIFLTEEILADVQDKLVRKIKVPPSHAAEIVAFLLAHACIVEAAPVAQTICRDPDDGNILGAAEAAQAQFIITGDDDLLVLQQYRGCRIVRPRSYWEIQAGQD
jgi:putative PIN family toxin of toxin-antitoxin system